MRCQLARHPRYFLIAGSPRFYDQGYSDGFSHGRIHGLVEGRAVGREKGYEMWEEIAYYEGFARVWESLGRLSRDGSSVEMEQEGMEVKKGEE